MSELLSAAQIERFRDKAAALCHPREMIIDVLRAIQDHHGWVPDEGVELTARIIGLSPLQVEEVATFYDKIYRRPVGRRVIHVCDSICCWSLGGEQVLDALKRELGIDIGQTTADGLFTLLPTCCLGLCGRAPAMTIGERIYERVSAESIPGIIAEERREAQG